MSGPEGFRPSSQLDAVRAEVDGLSEAEIIQKLRQDGPFVGRALGAMIEADPDFLPPEGAPTLTVDEVKRELGIQD